MNKWQSRKEASDLEVPRSRPNGLGLVSEDQLLRNLPISFNPNANRIDGNTGTARKSPKKVGIKEYMREISKIKDDATLLAQIRQLTVWRSYINQDSYKKEENLLLKNANSARATESM